MKIIVLKQTLESIDSLRGLKEPWNLYGEIRKSEQLAYVIGIGKHEYLRIIGKLSTHENPIEGYSLFALLKDNDIEFYFKEGKGWKEAQKIIVDLNDSNKRTPFPKHLVDVLKNSHVLMFGLGSMGSRIALSLTRLGIRHFKLIDPDYVSMENLSRHESDLLDLYRYKVQAIKERILRVNPLAKVEAFGFDIFQSEAIKEKVFANVDLVIATTDRTSVQELINYNCWRRKIPSLFAGCYDEARGGEVLFILPGETQVCLECLRGGAGEPERKGEISYSRARSHEDYEGEPGLSSAINLVSNVAEQYAIALLLKKEQCEMAKLIDPKNNLLFIGGALGKGFYYLKDTSCFTKPFEFIAPKLPGPWKECSTCQNKPVKNENA
jgi:molybdopterin/thiamine biosynthesis adenylyltransferase